MIRKQANPAPAHKEIVMRIRALIKKPAIFRNARFSRADLAAELGISEKLLSIILNNEMGIDFHSLINTQRAHHARRMLENPKYSTVPLDDIAAASGFQNRLTMHRRFIQLFNQSPGTLRENI